MQLDGVMRHCLLLQVILKKDLLHSFLEDVSLLHGEGGAHPPPSLSVVLGLHACMQ